MRELTDSDFVLLGGYAQRWRFAEFTYGYISPYIEQRVRPLGPEAALEAAREALLRHPPEPASLAGAVDLDTVRDPTAVPSWLRGLPVDGGTTVIVSWDPASAVVTDWDLFVGHWGAFCHDSSDDTTVWSPGAAWTLCFWHYGLLRFSSGPRAV